MWGAGEEGASILLPISRPPQAKRVVWYGATLLPLRASAITSRPYFSWRTGGDGTSGRGQTLSEREGRREETGVPVDLLRRGVVDGAMEENINEGGAGFCTAVKVKLWIRGESGWGVSV